MKSDNFELTWQQQVEYKKVHSFGRDVNNMFKNRKIDAEVLITYDLDLTVQELIDEL